MFTAFVASQWPFTIRDFAFLEKLHRERAQAQRRSSRKQIWQDENYDRIVRDEKELQHFRDYIECNRKIRLDCMETALFWQVNRVLQMNA